MTALGHAAGGDDHGSFGEGTEVAVRAFQVARGLRVDGICGPQTWNALVEAGYALGDRLLYHTAPPLRGDDVAELQRRLGTLGFDPGRVDGIFGERTQRALLDFQRNGGLTTDAVCGPATLAALARLGERARDDDNVASVREREALRRSAGSLEGRRIVVTEPGGLDALTAAIGGALRNAGAVVLTVHHPDGSEQAAQANGVAADVFVGFATHDDADCVTAYYKAPGYESSGGRRLADCLQAELAKVTGQPARDPDGMAVPALRETRMPAVLCELGPPELVVAHGPAVAEAVCDALTCWLRTLDQT